MNVARRTDGMAHDWIEETMATAMSTGVLPHYATFRDMLGMRNFRLMERYVADREVRNWFIDRYSFAIPCREAIDAIASHGPVLEVGAGSGLWAGILSRHVDVVATDLVTDVNQYRQQVGRWFPVQTMSAAEAVAAHPDRTVLMVWPSYSDRWAYDAARAMRPGSVLCYVGEGSYGCTGDDLFHRLRARRFDELDGVGIPQFTGLNDYLGIFRKKSPRLVVKPCQPVV